MQPQPFYSAQKESLSQQMNALQSKKAWLAWGRLAAVAGIALAIYLSVLISLFYLAMALVASAAFLLLIIKDLDNKNAITHTQYLQQVNEEEIMALAGNYHHFKDGTEHILPTHDYANDIDLFGRASIFQYLNRTSSQMGSATLADWLLHPADPIAIVARQEAVKALASHTDWQHQLRAYGKQQPIERSTQERLQQWLQTPSSFLQQPIWRWLQYLIPMAMLTIVALNVLNIVSTPTRNYALLASAIMAFWVSKKVVPLHQQLAKMAEELSVLSSSIALIEKSNFESPLLQQLKNAYTIQAGNASQELKQLKNIVARLDYRLNPVVFIPLALLLQWDLQQVMALEKWKRRNQQNINEWFEALGQWEALCSLATLHFNHPEWCFPNLKEEHFFIEGTAIGHPLIDAKKRVNNGIGFQKRGQLMLITGSNMAGKSTYLRSIGINVVLSMMGAPVCAKSFSLSPVQLITSMRIADNLEENTSTFYAELKKLKTIIEKVNAGEKVFILLDEILRGTNSLDRHTGSVALTKQLLKHQAAAIIATHDIELAQLKMDYTDAILNYHFDAQVSNDELYFDYQLKEGICSSINASILMKKIGIEL